VVQHELYGWVGMELDVRHHRCGIKCYRNRIHGVLRMWRRQWWRRWCSYSGTYSCTYNGTYSCTYSCTYSLTYSCTYNGAHASAGDHRPRRGREFSGTWVDCSIACLGVWGGLDCVAVILMLATP